MGKHIGILTAGGDSPGLNAAIRGIGKTAFSMYDMQVTGIYDGFRGLMENRITRLSSENLSGILTQGGTILGTSREKPHKMQVTGKQVDMTDVIVENYHKHHFDALVCIGGGGTQKNAFNLLKKGLNIITLPKTIDNDIYGTDASIGFDTALGIAVEAIDRLHSTAHSHHRIIIVEIMGHNAGWLTLGAGISGGADVILIPEIPYDIKVVAEAILQRDRAGKHFSIVAVAEGAMSKDSEFKIERLKKNKQDIKDEIKQNKIDKKIKNLTDKVKGGTLQLARQLERLTNIESRVTILGHLQRGGIPSAFDRLIATKLGSSCPRLIEEGRFGVLVAVRGEGVNPVPLEDIVGKRKVVPPGHPWIESARSVGTCLGDTLR